MLKRVLIVLVLLVLSINPVCAYEFPQETYFIDAYDLLLGDITIYFPINTTNLSLSDNDVVNVGSSNVTGYFVHNGTEYTITFQPFQLGRYRLSNTGSSYSYLDFSVINDTNIEFVNVANKNVINNYYYIIIALISLGVIGLWIPSYKH